MTTETLKNYFEEITKRGNYVLLTNLAIKLNDNEGASGKYLGRALVLIEMLNDYLENIETSGIFEESVDSLCDRTGMYDKIIKDYINFLINKGLIERIRRGCFKNSSLYTISLENVGRMIEEIYLGR